jgi:uncharacterized NAD(P)/FAD-binding protein YdhS
VETSRVPRPAGPALVIVGGGASGALVAMNLLRLAREPLEIAVVEPAADLCRGRAYPAGPVEHVLNVPAFQMSARPDDPDHFTRWLAARSSGDPSFRDAYAARSLWGAYLEESLADALRNAPAGVNLRHVRDRVVDLRVENGRAQLQLAGEGEIEADGVILALGHTRSSPPVAPAAGARVRWRDPLDPREIEGLEPGAPVVVAGSGLTTVDLALMLAASGHRGTITAVSRHGLLPRTRTAPLPFAAVESLLGQPRTARALSREIRRLAATHGPDSGGAVVNALRSASEALWASLPSEEKKRILRHAMPFWNVFRHRTAPEPGRTIDALRKAGTFRVVAGRFLAATGDEGDARVTVLPRGADAPLHLRAARIFDATGPGSALGLPLIRRLIDRGLAMPDALEQGLEADRDGRLLPGRRVLYGLGPVFRGRLWETTAIPEIRDQAARLAEALAGDMKS